MDQPTWEDLDDDEEEEGKTFEGPVASKDGLIFLVDATSIMFESADESETAFEISLRCVRNTLSNKVMSNYKDLVAVVFFGTKEDKNPSDFKHIYIYQDLSETGAERILQIETLQDYKKKDFEKEFGHSDSFSLSDALWTCSQLFSSVKLRLGNRQVLIFTNRDDPHAGNIQLQRQARAKAKDLHDLKIDVDLMHINRKNQDFDVKKFFRDIIKFSDAEDTEQLPDPSTKFDQLMKRVRHREHKRRALGRLRMTLGEGVELGVSLFNLVRSATKSYPVKLERTKNEQLNSMRRVYLGDTGAILMPSDIKMYQEYSGKKIHLEAEEVKEVKNCSETGLLLMGFKPLSSLKLHLHVRPCQFLYPDERSVTGSTSLFGALHQQCLQRKVVPICRFQQRNNVSLRFVALYPQEEEKDEDGVQTIPCGFHMIHIPYTEDLRKLNMEGNKRKPGTELVDKAKEIIKKLQFNFEPENFENPVLQQHWRNIEALALNRDETEEMTDYTLPNHDIMQKRAGHLIGEFRRMAFPKGMAEAVPEKKRPATQGGSATKRTKPDIVVSVDIKKEAELGQLNKLTVSVLKDFCKTNSIKCGSKKADIILAINEFLGVE